MAQIGMKVLRQSDPDRVNGRRRLEARLARVRRWLSQWDQWEENRAAHAARDDGSIEKPTLTRQSLLEIRQLLVDDLAARAAGPQRGRQGRRQVTSTGRLPAQRLPSARA